MLVAENHNNLVKTIGYLKHKDLYKIK